MIRIMEVALMSKGKDMTAAENNGGEVSKGAAPFTMLNYILFAAGLLDIILGWFLLRAGRITIAPIMLILGYCVIIPMAIILRKKQPENG